MSQQKFHSQEKEHGRKIKLLSYGGDYLLNEAENLQLALKDKGLNAERIALPISRAPQEQKIDWYSEYRGLKPMEDLPSDVHEQLKVRFFKFKDAILKAFDRESHLKGAFEKLFESDKFPDENGDAYEPWIWANEEDFTIIWGAYRAKDEITFIDKPQALDPSIRNSDPSPGNPEATPVEPLGSQSAGPEKIKGCTDPTALNYNPEATLDDGSCVYSLEKEVRRGCTDPKAVNYDPDAKVDDGSCIYHDAAYVAKSGGINRWFWFWLALAVALVIAILLVGCPSCERQVSVISGERIYNPAPDLLPEYPNKVLPIDPEVDRLDSTFESVVLNRINLYPKNQDADFEKFVRDTSGLCPDKSAKLIYWDPITKRIQLDFDHVEYPNMIVKMKKLLADYDPLIWNEMLFSRSVINDPLYKDLEKGWYFSAIHFDPAYLKLGDPEIKIAFVDDGFDSKHEDFSKIAAQGFDFFHHQPGVYGKMNGTNEYGQPLGNFHGTHVIGISSAQQNNGKGSLGLSPNCEVIPVQVSDEWSELWPSSVIIDAILFSINNGARVVNLSLGLPMTKAQWKSLSDTEKDLFIALSAEQASFWKELYAYGEELGVVFIKAAGNSGIPIEFDPMCRSNLPIYVMATDRANQLAEFSNLVHDKLNYTSVAAPGVEIFSTLPGDVYFAMSGTSMSAPMVSSLVALIFSKDAKMSPQEIRNIFQSEPKAILANDIHAPLLNFKSVLEKIDTQS